jgi:hypothetical protein
VVVVGLRSESCSVNISYSEMWSEVDVLSFFRKMPLIKSDDWSRNFWKMVRPKKG